MHGPRAWSPISSGADGDLAGRGRVDDRQCRRDGEIDQPSLGTFQVDVDLVGSRCREHDEEVQVVEFVLSGEKVDDSAEKPLETGVGWAWLFGFVPLSRHHLHIQLIDESARVLRSREFGGVIKTWNHDIVITPIDDANCLYRDRIEIAAGIMTPVVILYARWFYRTRQERRWRALAKGMKS